MLDPSGKICAFLILCCRMVGMFYYMDTSSWKLFGYFHFKCWYEFIGYDIFCAFYSQVWYIMSSVFKRDKVKLVFMVHIILWNV
jgi:hypothetical protein